VRLISCVRKCVCVRLLQRTLWCCVYGGGKNGSTPKQEAPFAKGQIGLRLMVYFVCACVVCVCLCVCACVCMDYRGFATNRRNVCKAGGMAELPLAYKRLLLAPFCSVLYIYVRLAWTLYTVNCLLLEIVSNALYVFEVLADCMYSACPSALQLD
jgi:hypothetical protein